MENDNKFKSDINKEFLNNESIGEYCQFGTGGRARYLFVALKIESLIESILFAQANRIPYCVIGSGAGLLFGDKDYNGLIIINRSSTINCIPENNIVVCDSGVKISQLASFTAQRNLSGLENFMGFPGTVGGSVYGNACSDRLCFGSFIRWMTILTHRGRIVKKDARWFEFIPRSCKLQKKLYLKQWTILTVAMQLCYRRYDEIQKDLFKANNANSRLKDKGLLCDIFCSRNEEISHRDIYPNIARGNKVILAQDNRCIRNIGGASSASARKLIEDIVEKSVESGRNFEDKIEYLGKWQ